MKPESHNGGEKKKQKTLDNHFYNVSQKHNMKLASRQDQFLGRALLVKWISESLRPFTLVEDSGFRDFCSFLNQLSSRYEVPSRRQYRRDMMDVADFVMKKVRSTIKEEVEYYSITTDIWSSRVMQSFISVTLHYLSEEFEMKNFVIEVAPITGSHTGDFIADFLRNTFSSFQLREEKLALLIRDNASNVIKACDNLNLDSFGCIGHSLHLVVGPFLTESKKPEDSKENVVHDVYFNDDDSDVDVFDDEDSFEDNSEEIVIRVRRVVSKFRNLAKYVKNSCKAKEKFDILILH